MAPLGQADPPGTAPAERTARRLRHTAQKTGEVWVGNHWVCIDTYAYGGMI